MGRLTQMPGELPAGAYALPGDRFVTVVYLSDLSEWRTCLKVLGAGVCSARYLPSTDTGWANERDARKMAAVDTYVDNGRADQTLSADAAAWVAAAT